MLKRRPIADAPDAQGALTFEERGEGGAGRIEKVSQHVNVAAVIDRRDLDAGHDANVGAQRGGGDVGKSGNGVVIGDADGREPRLAGAGDELAGVSRPSDAVVWR